MLMMYIWFFFFLTILINDLVISGKQHCIDLSQENWENIMFDSFVSFGLPYLNYAVKIQTFSIILSQQLEVV